jgi:hypothetical protein
VPQRSGAFCAKFPSARKIQKVYCINLDRQCERWKRVQSELGRIRDVTGLPLTNMLLRVSAIDARINKAPPDRREINPSYTLTIVPGGAARTAASASASRARA